MTTTYLDFLRDPDQRARRAELEAFFGPNAARFLPVYDRLRDDLVKAGTGRPRFRMFGGGFSFPAFLFAPVWFLYRKMWLIAAIVIGVSIAIGFLPVPPNLGLILSVILGLMAKRTYVQHAIVALQKARRTDGTIDPAVIEQIGGVSRMAGWIAGLLYGALLLAGLVSLYVLFSMHEPTPT